MLMSPSQLHNPLVGSRVAVDRMVVTGHRIDVPLDWNEPSGPQITVHARDVVAAEHARDTKRPAIVWFQGGPGYEVAFPDHRGSWLEQLLTRYRVLLLDQRGTGLSTPLEARALPFSEPAAFGDYCVTFVRTRSFATRIACARPFMVRTRTGTSLDRASVGSVR
jgi:pimeloyl-ACP methyl ester carboxylesterase